MPTYPPITAQYHMSEDMWSLRFRYHPELVDMIKTSVPTWAERSWDPDSRCWWVDATGYRYVQRAASLLGVIIQRAGGDEPPPDPFADAEEAEDAKWATVLFDAVGSDRIEAVFRALTRVLHPDNTDTGDTELMKQLNNARDKAKV